MRFDCGTTSEDYAKINALRCWSKPPDATLVHELVVLAKTPGVPIEWLYAAFRFGWRRRAWLGRLMTSLDLTDLARENATTVKAGDGLAMLALVGPDYSGAAPLYAKLDLEGDRRSDDDIAKVLGVNRLKVLRWRRNVIFCPLTGVRLVGTRGTF